jgi:hypothetical protein
MGMYRREKDPWKKWWKHESCDADWWEKGFARVGDGIDVNTPAVCVGEDGIRAGGEDFK